MTGLRIDKWLWAARFYKTRSLATEEIGKHRVQINGDNVKPAREVKLGDTVSFRQGQVTRTVSVRGLSGVRGPAPVARELYEETAESLAAQVIARDRRHFAREPALSIEQGRPTKRERRDLDQAAGGWGTRWSASIDDKGTEPRDDKGADPSDEPRGDLTGDTSDDVRGTLRTHPRLSGDD